MMECKHVMANFTMRDEPNVIRGCYAVWLGPINESAKKYRADFGYSPGRVLSAKCDSCGAQLGLGQATGTPFDGPSMGSCLLLEATAVVVDLEDRESRDADAWPWDVSRPIAEQWPNVSLPESEIPPAFRTTSADSEPRQPGCRCHLEVGDSPCPVHPSHDDEVTPWSCPVDSHECHIRRECTNKCGAKDVPTVIDEVLAKLNSDDRADGRTVDHRSVNQELGADAGNESSARYVIEWSDDEPGDIQLRLYDLAHGDALVFLKPAQLKQLITDLSRFVPTIGNVTLTLDPPGPDLPELTPAESAELVRILTAELTPERLRELRMHASGSDRDEHGQLFIPNRTRMKWLARNGYGRFGPPPAPAEGAHVRGVRRAFEVTQKGRDALAAKEAA